MLMAVTVLRVLEPRLNLELEHRHSATVGSSLSYTNCLLVLGGGRDPDNREVLRRGPEGKDSRTWEENCAETSVQVIYFFS